MFYDIFVTALLLFTDHKNAEDTYTAEYLQKLKDLGIDVTTYLVSQMAPPADEQIQVVRYASNTTSPSTQL